MDQWDRAKIMEEFQKHSHPLKENQESGIRNHILSDDTDVFVLLVYWVWKANVHSAVQMEKWDGTILDINATVKALNEKCQGLLGMHALSGCDSVSYPCGKGKVSALKVLLGSAMPGLNTVLGEPGATHSDLKQTGTEFFLALYSMKKAKSMNQARYQIFRQRTKPPDLKKLPPTDENMVLHIMHAHLQVMLWKAADQRETQKTSEILGGRLPKKGLSCPLCPPRRWLQ